MTFAVRCLAAGFAAVAVLTAVSPADYMAVPWVWVVWPALAAVACLVTPMFGWHGGALAGGLVVGCCESRSAMTVAAAAGDPGAAWSALVWGVVGALAWWVWSWWVLPWTARGGGDVG